MILALILNAIDPAIGGVLIQGQRGTAKSTAARSLSALLPPSLVIKGCAFACDPKTPVHWCTTCKEMFQFQKPETEFKSTAFINLPVSATEDRVVGTLDIETAIQTGKRTFQPGLLASANRGLLYIDEVNLLDDHVVDVLLDAAAMGVNIVEREGISFSHPSRFILVGTMNPVEGTLRPQLTDRFGLSVFVKSVLDLNRRILIIQRTLAYEEDPLKFYQIWKNCQKKLTDSINQARLKYHWIEYSKSDLEKIAELTTHFGVEGHRGVLVILKTARANAAYHDQKNIETQDIIQAAQLAIPHRLKSKPFDQPIEWPEIEETTRSVVYPERKARLEEILSDFVDPTSISDLHNECGYYLGG